MISVDITWPYRMDHILCGKLESQRDNGRTSIAVPDPVAGLCHFSNTCIIKDVSAYASALHKPGVCSIDNGIRH